MSPLNEFFMILGMVVVTFSIRYVLLAFSGGFSLPATVQKALGYVPPAVLTAIIVPAVLMPGGSFDFSINNGYLSAAVVAVAAGFLFPKRVLAASISSGLIVFFLVRFIFM